MDHLLSIGHAKDPLKMTLDEAIIACKAGGVLSDKTGELSTVIRRYRNLIHPGRALRLSETADAQSATVCHAHVQMISVEVANSRRQTYGYTAEQISSKVERDSSSVVILPHFLKKSKDAEIERLLLDVLPERYFSIEPETGWEDARLNSIEKAFQLAYEAATDTTKTKVAKRFVTILHEEDETRVLTYERVFFRTSQLEHLDDDDRKTVKQHIVAQLRDSPTKELFDHSLGIGKFLDQTEIVGFVDAALRPFLDSKKEYLHSTFEGYISDLYSKLPQGMDENVNLRLESWVKSLKQRDRHEDAERVQALIYANLPF